MRKIIPDKYFIAGPVLGGIISGFGSLVGSSIGALSAYSTNKTNKEIAEMNNQAMLQAMREQTRSEQHYNSASEQMKRLQMAGLNPMSLAGQNPTPVSSAGVPSLDTPVMQNPFGEFDLGLSHVGSALIQSANLDNQARSIDVQDFASKVDMLKTIGDLSRDTNLTSDDVRNIVSSVMGKDNKYSAGLQDLVKDNFVVTRLNNTIETSNLSLKEKQFLYGWLDEFTSAEYQLMLADIDSKQSGSALNRSTVQFQRSQEDVNRSTIDLNKSTMQFQRSQEIVNASIASLNDEKRKEIEQAIANMKEQFKSLQFQGELDAKKLLRVAELSDNLVDMIVNQTKVSKKDANSYVWRTSIMPMLQQLMQSGSYIVGKLLD